MTLRVALSLIVLAAMGCSDTPDVHMMDYKAYRHGPHVIVDGDAANAFYFKEADDIWTVEEVSIADRDVTSILVENPLFAPFPVNISRQHATVPSTYPAAENILVIADIEGNFAALYALLVSHKVIDYDGNWTYGAGHLVMLGDLYDRGPDVTPVLWLLYKLESEAQRSGGRVHVLLGNHETMIFGGDTRYINPKYREQATATGIQYADLYAPNSVLGQWMRNKPAIIRIGDVLFSHAGISEEVLALQMDLEEMNASVRNYNLSETDTLSPEQATLFGVNGIFWYRDWVDDPPGEPLLDTILDRYQATRMVIGHTLVPEVLVTFAGKLAMTDLQQPRNLRDAPARALLIRGDQLFEVNSRGETKEIE